MVESSVTAWTRTMEALYIGFDALVTLKESLFNEPVMNSSALPSPVNTAHCTARRN